MRSRLARHDPILGKDVGFYVFQLPLLEAVQATLLGLVVVALIATVAVYGVAGTVSLDAARGLRVGPAARRHVSVLAAALLLVFAFGAWLDVPRLLVTSSGLLHGATNADVAVMIPALRVLLVAAVIGAGLALAQTRTASWWPLLTAAALYGGVSAAGTGAAAVMQRFVIAPNEQVRELPYIEHNIAATRAAFGLDTVEERELSGDALLTRADIDANAATLGNVRLWDHQPLLQTFAQIQEIRTYYDFVSVHNDRYKINGEYRQIMLSARELNSESLPNRNWINERLTFTHGYGVTLGPVNQVTPEGLPVLFIKDLPPQSSVDLTITEPSIYFGQQSNDHVFVKTKAREFHYPKGEDNVYSTYEGAGGVPISNFLRRVLFSIRFRSFKVLLSDDITNESRVMFHRRLNERVSRVAPFLELDGDPYLVISQGRLFWMQDAYTVSRHYPYSTPAVAGVNYIRNSVKITVDAFHGTIAFYLIDESDPVARTLRQAFPTLFRPLTEMPEDMRTRMRYPEGIFAHPGRDVRDLPHDQPGGLLQQGRPVGSADHRRAAAAPRDAALLHDDAAAGRAGAGVHPDAAVHAGAQGQPGVVDGRAQRRRQLRPPARLPVSEAESGVRAAPDRRAHQPGSGHRAADHAVESAGLGSAARHAAGDPDRGVAASTSGRSTCGRPAAASRSSSASSSRTTTRS